MIPYLDKSQIDKGFPNHVIRLLVRIMQNPDL